jgi:hypothetical protein
MATTQYEMPGWGTSADRLLGWLLEAVQEGQGWLNAQRPQGEWDKVLEMLCPNVANELANKSNTGFNKGQRVAVELVAGLSNYRYEGEIKPRWDQGLFSAAHMLTRLDKNWYRECNAREPYRAAIQYGVAKGTGYLVDSWDKDFHGAGMGDIRLGAWDPSDVMFVQMPRDHDLQRAYLAIIRYELPINLAKRIYGNIADQLVPDREAPGWIMQGLTRLQRLAGLSPIARFFGGTERDRPSGTFPTVDIFHTYCLSNEINQGPTAVEMGVKGTNWSYTVPALGDGLPTGVINPETGQQFTRPALEDDCRLFPLRRLNIFSRTAISYDGSSPWWHGQAPISRIRFNDWPWEALGQSLVGNLRTMQDGIELVMRNMENMLACRADPPVLYDDQLVSPTFAEAFDVSKAGAMAKATLNVGEVLKFPVDPSYYEPPNGMFQYLKDQESRMDYLAAVQDLTAVAKAKQLPAADSMEKLLEMAGPVVQDRIQALERPFWECGTRRIAYFLQFYTRARMIQDVGPDEQPLDMEFLPETLLAFQPGEPLITRSTRMRKLVHDFRYNLSETAMNELHRMSTKLAFLQLVKLGFPISWWTLAKIFRVPNFAPRPSDPEGKEITEELPLWIAQQHIMHDLAEDMGGGQVGPGAGRPHSNKQAPRFGSKDGGTRSIVKTS